MPALNSTPASVDTIKKGMYCPQNRHGILQLGLEKSSAVMVGFAHVKEGEAVQLKGLTGMLKQIVSHKGKGNVSAFACGTTGSTKKEIKFREKIKEAVEEAGISDFDHCYGEAKCMAWLCSFNHQSQQTVVGTTGLNSCIGVAAWSPADANPSLEYIDTSDVLNIMTLINKVKTIQEPIPKSGELESVDLKLTKYRIT